jgi:putative MATE family efflux protein
VGTTELAAIGLVDAVTELWIVPAVGLVEAMQITVARRLGARREEAIGPVFARAFLLTLAVSLALALALRVGAGPVGGRLIGSPGVAEAVEDFFRAGAFGLVFLSLNLAFGSLYAGLARTRVLVVATLVLTVANIVLSYGLIFGALGLPRLGIEGAGYGFLGSELITFLFLAAVTLRRFGLRSFTAPPEDGGVIRSLARTGSPIALQGLVEGLRWFAFFLVVERAGENVLAGSTIVDACFGVLVIPSIGFADAAFSLVSNLVGGGRGDRIGLLLRALFARASLVALPLLLVALVAPDFVVSLFGADAAVAEGTAAALRVVALGLVVITAADLWLAAVFATDDGDAGFVIELVVSATVVALAFLAAVVLDLGLAWVWASLPAAALIGLGLSYRRLRSGAWQGGHT